MNNNIKSLLNWVIFSALLMAVLVFSSCFLFPEKENEYVTITFDLNGGNGTLPDPITVHNGTRVELPKGKDFSKPPLAFEGWNTKANGSGTVYRRGDSIYPEKDLKFYAIWSLPIVSYDLNGGNGTTPDSQIVELGTVIKFPPMGDINRDGYKFGGWKESEDYYVYRPGSNYTVNGHVTILASWNKIYIVTYEAGGGTGTPPEPEEVASGEIIYLRYNTFTNEGYRFLGWYSPNVTVLGGGSPFLSPGSSVIVRSNINFTARWGI